MPSTFPNGVGFGVIPGPDQTPGGFLDGYVVRLSASGTAFEYATFVGGANADNVAGVAIDSSGRAVVVGSTSSTEATFPDGNGFGPTPGADTTFNVSQANAFVAPTQRGRHGVRVRLVHRGRDERRLYARIGSRRGWYWASLRDRRDDGGGIDVPNG